MYSALMADLILPVAERALHLPIHGQFSRLLDTQWWSEKELREIQRAKLVNILLHAKTHIPFFCDALRSVPASRIESEPESVLGKLSYLTKEVVRENFPDRIVAQDIPASKCKRTTTAGSTGKPLTYLVSRNGYAAYWAQHLRAFKTAGYSLGDKIVYVASIRELSGVRRIRDFLIRQKEFDAYETSDELFRGYLRYMREHKPKILRGYPEILFLLADLAERDGIRDVRPASIITNSTKLFDFQRRFIEKVFQAPVFDYYSCPESGAFAFECEKHEGYHLALEHGLVELADPSWAPMKTGTGAVISAGAAIGTGAVVSTNLDNLATGFIKYVTGDVATSAGRVCSCGRGLPLIDAIEGRSHSIVITKDGRYLHGTLFEGAFLHTEMFKEMGQWVDRIQFVQENEDLLVIKIVREPNLDRKGLDLAVQEVKRMLGPGMAVEVQFVDSIDMPDSGKRQLVVSKVLPERMKDRLKEVRS